MQHGAFPSIAANVSSRFQYKTRVSRRQGENSQSVGANTSQTVLSTSASSSSWEARPTSIDTGATNINTSVRHSRRLCLSSCSEQSKSAQWCQLISTLQNVWSETGSSSELVVIPSIFTSQSGWRSNWLTTERGMYRRCSICRGKGIQSDQEM